MIHSTMKNNNENDYSHIGINSLFNMLSIKFFVTKSIRQLISGYKDPLMNLAKNFVSDVKESKFSLLTGVII
jgi:hypothetical protein